MKNTVIIVLISICFSCQQKIPAKNQIDYAALKNTVVNETQHFQPNFDSIRIYTGNGDSLSSMYGNFFLAGDLIGFADKQLCSILFYDSLGHFLTSRLQRGRGPNEILGLDRIAFFPNRSLAILDGNWYLSVYDSLWTKTHQNTICWYSKKNRQEIETLKRSTDVNNFALYSFEYEGGKIKVWNNNHLIVPINTELRKCNAYLNDGGDYYYENAYSLGIINIDSGQLIQTICPRPPLYLQHRFIPNFRHVIFDVHADTLFFSFEADSLIYCMTLPEGKNIKTYGLAGKEMNTDYRTTTNYEEAKENYGEDIFRYGNYTYLKYIPETNLLFRGYRKGNHNPNGGLQVYCQNRLMYDFEIPVRFEVFAYRKPYYYAQCAPDNDKEEMVIYKFKLN